ncbi:sigma-E processing peptidase SpoIIGA [Paenibacillus sp. OV219]|uniref:sigma-E processing peptidase SpoIIGA n=1 Tax=Paenibacillus sp. OV219 TaxID=1884377 RepID=UPI0008AACBC3|nr:sigma-E processing peptidase SpoIIGA [Paenibacillus sp. OV219]SEN12286.1 sporulation factor SpoIIGA. Unknown type peptidase. MEROPS family U04 [Paenibacillus sp. OV219]
MNTLDAVYIDVLFMVNLLIDGSNLLLTAWVRSIRAKWWRVLLAAIIGALYAILIVFPPLSFLFTIVIKIALSFAMLLTAFGFGSVQHFVRNVGAFYGVNFAAAGAVLGAHYLLMNSSNKLWQTVVTVNGSPSFMLKSSMLFVFCLVGVGYYIYRSVMTQRKERNLVTTHLAEVKVRVDGVEHTCTGLIDTGNQLYEPLTRTPVMVMEAAVWQDVLPASWIHQIREAQVDKLLASMTDEEPFIWRDRLRLVPYRGVNRGAQFMLAIKPDLVTIDREGELFESKKVLIGLDAGKLTHDGTYQAIIHPSLLQNRSVTVETIHSTSGRDGAACSSNGN